MDKRDLNYAMVGGGIGGLSTAVALQRKGFNAVVYEAAPDFQPLGAGVSPGGNAVKAYRDIGIEAEVVGAGKPLTHAFIKEDNARVITHTDVDQMTRQLGVLNTFTIHRADLHEPWVICRNGRTVSFVEYATRVSEPCRSA